MDFLLWECTVCLKSTYKDGILNGESMRYDLQGNIIAKKIILLEKLLDIKHIVIRMAISYLKEK